MALLRAFIFCVGLLFTLASAHAEPHTPSLIDLRHDLEAGLMRGEYAGLDVIAAEYRASHAKASDGYLRLHKFYWTLTQIKEGCGQCSSMNTSISFDEKRRAVERWISLYPASLTAKIVLAELWKNYADVGRGGDFAQKTSAAQFAAQEQRLSRAIEILSTLNADSDPRIYALQLSATTQADDPKAALSAIYERATRAFPDVCDYAVWKHRLLMPYWYGQPGEAQAFARSLLERSDLDHGLSDYFAIAADRVKFDRNTPDVFANTGIDYAALVKAFASRAAANGPNKWDMNVLLWYTVAASDKKTAAFLANRIGRDWYSSVWQTKAYYDSVVQWANSWP